MSNVDCNGKIPPYHRQHIGQDRLPHDSMALIQTYQTLGMLTVPPGVRLLDSLGTWSPAQYSTAYAIS
ncbi:mRNA export protein mlo3 [Fusarium oxysporum f. sp. albedinis]|nr:mRNA export protein mlo3 [Fusarium oxysporum f. sp. albedinis]